MRPLVLSALAASLLACGSTQKRGEDTVATVSPADLGRLAPEQMGPVQTARADHDAARDAVARARLRLQDSRHEESFAHADRTDAEADRQRAEAELKAAQQSGDPSLLARANELAEAAALRQQAADARLDFARRLVAAREAEIAALDARVRRGEWAVERAKLTALEEAGIPAASKYDAAALERQVGEAARAEEGARVRALELERAAVAARDRWRGLVERYEARARSLQGSG